MPFFDDSGPRPEEERSPLWRSFALVKDQLERLILVNLLWSLQSVPLLLAFAFPEWPAMLRLIMTLYTALMLAPATATLFAVVGDLSDGTPIDGELLWRHFKMQFRPAFLKLLPLLSLFYWSALLSGFAAERNWLIVDVLARLTVLLLLVLAMWWGPLLVYRPDFQAWDILVQSALHFWQFPGQTLAMGVACLLAILLGLVSIAGWLLIVPVLVALFQVELYRATAFKSGLPHHFTA
ncbi:MAG: hypothetical protein N2049_08740 [Anaerolineales bacterium]|nr:hypothetical protein [Anaerolineales bacterium]MDW8227141.1 hypothetical protein [Anaerolineales bacterium]